MSLRIRECYIPGRTAEITKLSKDFEQQKYLSTSKNKAEGRGNTQRAQNLYTLNLQVQIRYKNQTDG
jgi:hypothetical protein